MTKDNLGKMMAGIDALVRQDVLIGIPGEKTERNSGDPLTNASLGYIHENGAPEANIPARPFLAPGIKEALPRTTKYFQQAAQYAGAGNMTGMMRAFNAIGQVAADSARNVIRRGISPPLKQGTVDARKRRHKSRKAESSGDVTPLIDTGQLYRAITYVVREK